MILSTFQFSIVLYWHGRCAEKKVDEQIFYVNILPFPQAGLNSGFRVWKVTFKTQLPMPSKILFGHISVKGFNAITANGLLHFALLFFAGDNTCRAQRLCRNGSHIRLSSRNDSVEGVCHPE